MNVSDRKRPNFDRLAHPYRWLEYLTFGRALERCRLHFLPQLAGCTRALVLGDGDGRFLARLLAANPHLTADAVDTSAVMLRLLRQRCASNSARVTTHHADALAFTSTLGQDIQAHPQPGYDLVVTHFFLDCLSQSQVDDLAVLASHMPANALWLVSDFQLPPGPMHLPARMLVRSLYLAFRILTGLRATRLPDHAGPLTRAGFTRISRWTPLFGLLTTELWSVPAKSNDQPRSASPLCCVRMTTE